MAAGGMGAAPQQGKNTKPKLAVKPPMALLATRSSASWLRSPSPDASKSNERASAKRESSAERESERKLPLSRIGISRNTIAGECELRPPDTGNIPVNILAKSARTSVVPRQARRKITKPPKPLPYLEPISSYAALREGRRSSAGRSAHRERRRRVTFAKSVKYQRFRYRRASSEKLTKGPELAYLVVDLQSGTLAYSSDLCCRPRSESVEERLVTTHLNSEGPPARPRTMSVDAKLKPKPLPRRKPCISPAESGTSNSDSAKKETDLTSQVGKQLPNQRNLPPSCTQSSEQTQDNDSSPTKQQTKLNDKESSPLKDSVLIPIPRRRSVCNTYTPTKSQAPMPSTNDCSKSSSPAEDHKPPPLPAKSELSRSIQRSIKAARRLPPKPPSPEPYEAPRKIELEEIDTHQNDSYGSHGNDENFSDYDNSSKPLDLSADKPEEMYIDPLQSSQFSSSGKPKPARPPPPSSSAIRRAQLRKAQSLNVNKPVKTGGKQLTKHKSAPNKPRAYKGCTLATVTQRTSHAPTLTTRPAANTTRPPANMPPDYEELDFPDDTPTPLPPTTPWKPPPSLPSPNSTRRFSSDMDNAGTAPALPPRSQKPSPSRLTSRVRQNDSKPIPSGFSHSTSSGILNSADEKTSVTSNTGNTESSESRETWEEDSVYEPVNASTPCPPVRTKRNARGAWTRPGEQLVHPKPPPLEPRPLSRSGTAPRLPSTSKSSRSSKQELRSSTSLSPQPKPLPSSVDVGRDEGGTEEYVEMHCRVGWTKEEDMPEEYVDMLPSKYEVEDGPSMGPYASNDLLASRPDLKHTH